MTFPDVIDLTDDDDSMQLGPVSLKHEEFCKSRVLDYGRQLFCINATLENSRSCFRWQGSEKSRNLNNVKVEDCSSSALDQESAVIDASSPLSTSPLYTEPLCRQFWKAGNFETLQATKISAQYGKNHLRVHPNFLHSNATSHKWALGAIAELVDNAFDEIANGATFVNIDKTTSPRDGSPALLIQDDGGGMDPETMRRCLSFGFSDKSKLAIGQYGNGFKTSTMRLGADAIVFTRITNSRVSTQSVGLLSYTFLRQSGHEEIVVPMLDYNFNPYDGSFGILPNSYRDQLSYNLSLILQWSPYATKDDLHKQFHSIGNHGTKIIIYNLWYNDDGDMELDFDSDEKDIALTGAPTKSLSPSSRKYVRQWHIASRYRYSLRVYLSILYLHMPITFKIFLCGQVVEQHCIAKDLKYVQCIQYKPKDAGNTEVEVITTIGFTKEAPQVDVHGYNVYHKNRLIMPFWRVVHESNSIARGVVGVLEANFVEPTHDKQGFEKTSLFQKLELRLKQMTLEYWKCHCHLIGYHPYLTVKNASVKYSPKQAAILHTGTTDATGNQVVPASKSGKVLNDNQTKFSQDFLTKRKAVDPLLSPKAAKQAMTGLQISTWQQWEHQVQNNTENQEAQNLIQENTKLREQCLLSERNQEELNEKVLHLKTELQKVQQEYERLLVEAMSTYQLKTEFVN